MIYLDCYTDASVDLNREIVCSAFVVVQDNQKTIHQDSTVYKGRCNNQGELIAIFQALEWIESLRYLSNYHIYIKTDSEDAIRSILYARQGISLTIRSKQINLKSKLDDLKIIRVQRSQVSLAHSLARRSIKKEIDKLSSLGNNRQHQIDKRIERQWLLSKWLEVCK